MPLVYDGKWSEEQIDEVAKLMSHLGHAFMVSFGSNSTSVSDPQNTDKLNKYFNYNLVYASYQRDFTIDAWKEKIKESINNCCPIPYASDNAGTGDTRHMFVLDGYTANDYFHFNFGWNGNGNGWFKLDAITPSQGDNYSWQNGADHYAIFNFTPNKTKYAVNASVSPANAGTVSINGSAAASSATGEYIEGATVTLTATANTGYTFSNWTKGGEVVSTNKSCTVKVASSDNDYVANFTEGTTGGSGGGTTVEKEFATDSSNGYAYEQNPNTNENSFYKAWKYNTEPQMTLKSSGYTITVGASTMNLRAAEYTISVPDDFEIVSYTINFKTNYNAAITAGATSQEYTKANGLTFTAEEVNTKESSFNLSIDTGRYIQVTGIYMILKTTDENTTGIDERKGENVKLKGFYIIDGKKRYIK